MADSKLTACEKQKSSFGKDPACFNNSPNFEHSLVRTSEKAIASKAFVIGR